MADHSELVAEINIVEKLPTQDRLKHARKRRSQQLKRWANYEKQLEKQESSKKKKHNVSNTKRNRRQRESRVVFPDSVMLLEGAARNDVDEVRKWLSSGVSPDVTNEDGLTALHQCCIDDSEEMLLLLLEFGASVNARDSELWAPLHAAATCGHVHLCKHLIDKGAELLAVNADGNMPYDICEDEITLDYIETEMAKRGITQEQIDETRLVVETKMIEDLQSGKINLEKRDFYGATPLHVAAANGYLEVVKYLLDNHVSLDTRDDDSWQPIHAAACWMQPEVLELLVQHGADLDAKTRSGETAFDICEDPEMKQKILDMKDEIETNKASRSKDHVRRHKISMRGVPSSTGWLYSSNSSLNDKSQLRPNVVKGSQSSSIRRSSLRGEKSPLFMKEAKEEALHFGLRATADEENENEEEDKVRDNMPMTNIDDVQLQFEDEIFDQNKPEERTTDANILNKTNSSDRSKPVSPLNTNPSTSGSTKDSQNKPSSDSLRGKSNQELPPNRQNLPQNPQSRDVSSVKSTAQQGGSSLYKSSSFRKASAGNPSLRQADSRPPSGTPTGTLADLKKQRTEVQPRSKESTVDTQVQNMFLDSLNVDNNRYNSSPPQRPQAPVKQFRNQNGHNNNKPSSYPTGDIPLRRFTAPGTAPVVGDEEKQACCILM